MKKWKEYDRLSRILISFISFFFIFLVGLLAYNLVTYQTIEDQKKELVSYQKQKEEVETKHQEVSAELVKEEERITKELIGFPVVELGKDKEMIRDYLNLIFTWTSGDQYDSQRNKIKAMNTAGTDKILNTLMMENYRVPVPENLKGKLKDNDIDINGLKSQMINLEIHRDSWTQSSAAEVTYTALLEYQVYIDKKDLTGDYKTTRKLMFTFTLSDVEENRSIREVTYSFVQ
ncbi:hypothetical protein ACXM1Q_004820 [Streptococcus sp. 10F2]